MAILTVAILSGLCVSPAAAQRGRPSSAQMKQMQQQQQQQQQNMYGIQLVLEKRQKEVLAKYDLNGDGKLDAKEKPSYDKYMREVRSGKQPNPFDPSTVTQQDIDAALKAAPGATQANQAGNKPATKKPATTTN
jgi:hypothetical protein